MQLVRLILDNRYKLTGIFYQKMFIILASSHMKGMTGHIASEESRRHSGYVLVTIFRRPHSVPTAQISAMTDIVGICSSRWTT